MKSKKSMFFIMALMVLIIGIGAVGAADVSDNNTATAVASDSIDTVSSDANSASDIAGDAKDTETVKSEVKTDTKDVTDDSTTSSVKTAKKESSDVESSVKTTETTEKSIKTATKTYVNQDNFTDVFTSEGIADDVSDIEFTSDVSLNGTNVLVNKPVIINGNGYTLSLNTTSSGYTGDDTGSAFMINNGGSGTTVSNLKFYNTQVFVRNATNVVIENITSEVKNQNIGSGVGTFSVRDGSTHVIVKDSTFYTENNGGYSTLVLAGVYNCTFDNNTVTGVGTVGNLIYLTTYNVQGIDVTNMTVNSYNNITNNRVYGPANKSGICIGITLSGNNNLVKNNSVYYTGVGMAAQWMSTSTTNTSIGEYNQRYIGNDYYDNKLYNGSSFTSTTNGTIKNNYFSGSVNAAANATFENNMVLGSLTIAANSTVRNNVVQGTATVKGSNVVIENNSIHGLVTINGGVSNATIQNNNFCSGMTVNNLEKYDNYNNDCNDTCNCGVSSCSCMGNVVTTTSKSLKSEDDDNNIVYVTKDNVSDYFSDLADMGVEGYAVTNAAKGKTLVLDSTVPSALSKYTYIYLGLNRISYNLTGGNNNVVFYNHVFNLNQARGTQVVISNMTLGYDSSYPTYQTEDPQITILLANANLTCVNVTFKANIDDLNDINYGSRLVYSGGDDKRQVIFKDCTFNFTIPGVNIDYNSGYTYPHLIPIQVTSNTTFINCSIYCYEGDATDDVATTEPIYVTGDNNTIINSTIYMEGKKYLYGAYFASSSNNLISGNNVTVNGSLYANGFYFAGSGYSNNTIINNKINLTVGDFSKDENPTAEASGYAINFDYTNQGGSAVNPEGLTVWNSTIANNTIVGTGYNLYAIEFFGAHGNYVIANNTINLTGSVPSGITLNGYNCTISGNDITLNGETNETYGSTADNFKTPTAGIYIQQGLNNTVTNNTVNAVNGFGVVLNQNERNSTVANNTIISKNEYTIKLSNEGYSSGGVPTGNIISDNKLSATSLTGDESVYVASGEDNTIKDNTDAGTQTKLAITIPNTNIIIGDNVTVNVVLKDINDVPISGDVNVTIGDNTETLTTDESGSCVYNYTASKAQENVKVIANYYGNANYYASESNEVLINITKITPAVTVNVGSNNTAKVNKETTIKGTVTDNNNNPISNMDVAIFVNGSLLNTTKTDENGAYSYAYTPSLVQDDLNITVSVVGTDKYDETVQTALVKVEKLNTITTVNPVNGTYKEVTTVVAYVVDETGANATSGSVNFIINGTVVAQADVVNGIAQADVTLLKEYNNTNIQAVYADSDNVYADSLSENNTVTVSLRTATLDLVTDVISAKIGDKILFIAHVTDNGVSVNQGYVAFKLNGITLNDTNGTRNKVKVVNGIAQFEYTLPNYSSKVYNITVVYGGRDYNRAEDYGYLTVIKTNTHIQGNVVNITSTGMATLKVNVYDENNNLIDFRNTTVSIKVNGITVLDKVTVVNGETDFNVQLPTGKPYNITIIAGENNLYMGSTATLNYVNPLPKVTATVSADTQADGADTAVSINVRDEDGNLVKESPKIAIKVDGKTVSTDLRAVNGTLNATIPTPAAGSHQLLVIAGETSSYASARNETTIEI